MAQEAVLQVTMDSETKERKVASLRPLSPPSLLRPNHPKFSPIPPLFPQFHRKSCTFAAPF